jgi:hypothetical protein
MLLNFIKKEKPLEKLQKKFIYHLDISNIITNLDIHKEVTETDLFRKKFSLTISIIYIFLLTYIKREMLYIFSQKIRS